MNKTKIILFGPNGMLGNYINKYFTRNNWDCISFSRMDIDLSKDNVKFELYNILNTTIKSNEGKSFVIINCSGVIKQRNYTVFDLVRVNSEFPHYLELFKKENKNIDLNIIHITTDCVFSGNKGDYIETDHHDCLDDYGKSKSLGEPKNITVIRTSIIGEEVNNKLSLIEWVKSKQNQIADGYTEHYWNGVTCLMLAKQIEILIKNKNFWNGVKHFYTKNPYGENIPPSKYNLVSTISKIFDLNINVTPKTTAIVNRTLKSIYTDGIIDVNMEQQLIELKEFKL